MAMSPTNERMSARRREPERANVVVGSLWMVGISLALFWIPLLNGLIGGIVGGYKVGTIGRALAAAVLPAVVVALALWLLLAAFDLGGWGFLAGIGVGALILFSDVGLFLGAAIGGAWADARARRRLPA